MARLTADPAAANRSDGPLPGASLDIFLIFLLVGFAAQAIDGALGMAYGVVSSTVLISLGVPPATASASVHAAEVFTTAASAGSHIAHKNVDWRFLLPLATAGVIGGAFGAYVLTSIDGDDIKPVVVVYLGLMGALLLYRAWRAPPVRAIARRPVTDDTLRSTSASSSVVTRAPTW